MPKKPAPKKPARTTKPASDAPSWRGDDAAKSSAKVVQANLEAAIRDHLEAHGATSRVDLVTAMLLEGFKEDGVIGGTITDMLRSDALDIDEDNLLVLPKVEGLNGETNGVAKTHDVNGHATPEQNFAAGEGEALESNEYAATRYLCHVLTADEITALREEREMLDADIDILQVELDQTKERAKSLQKRIDTKSEDGRMLSKRVRTGEEYRDVPCEERRGSDPREGATQGTQGMVTYRLDTGECVDWRELSKSERQGVLFSDSPAETRA